MLNKNRKKIDGGAVRDKCHNVVPFCGEEKNTLVNNRTQGLIERSGRKSQILYFPTQESTDRRQYKIILEVWNFNLYWKN